jgi:tetratricopeptide (TPR) repeat protein
MEPTARSYPYRRVLQKATTVEEAIALFQSDFPIVIAFFGVVADAAGDIALVECTTTRCEVFRPEQDWFAHSNHARTEGMQDVDKFRGPDSLDRRRLMEAAFAPHQGRLDPARGAEILRNREGHTFPNASVVGNLFALNAAVLEPARRVLWHSDRIEPYAPFGSYVPIAIDGHGEGLQPVPASAFLKTEAYRAEAQAIAAVRAALNAQLVAGDLERANQLWAELFNDPPTQLDVSLLALGWAYSLLQEERFDECATALGTYVAPTASREARVNAALLRGVCEDGRGERDRAVASYARASALMDEVPDYSSYDFIRGLAAAGQAHALAPEDVELGGWLTHTPP